MSHKCDGCQRWIKVKNWGGICLAYDTRTDSDGGRHRHTGARCPLFKAIPYKRIKTDVVFLARRED